MTAHTPAQFTPAQVLDAGLRAETEGRYDFAVQVYRHLLTQYPMTPEAHAAQEGMARLAPPQPAYEPPGYDSSAFGPSAFGPGPEAEPPRYELAGYDPPPALPEPMPPIQVPPRLSLPGDASHRIAMPPPRHVPVRRPISIAPAGRAAEPPPFVAPRPVRDYLAGRIAARLMTWIGWLNLLLGIGLVPVSLLAPEVLSAVPGAGRMLSGTATAGGFAGSGLALLLIGQIVRALLDQANATRDLAALSRARADHEGLHHASGRHGRP